MRENSTTYSRNYGTRARLRNSNQKEPAAVAVTLKDLQIKMYTCRWPVREEHVVYLNISNKEKKEDRLKVACRRTNYTKSKKLLQPRQR
jgi:hypothetical protein